MLSWLKILFNLQNKRDLSFSLEEEIVVRRNADNTYTA